MAVDGELIAPVLLALPFCGGKPALAAFGDEASAAFVALLPAPTTEAYEKGLGLLTLVLSSPAVLPVLVPVGSARSAGSGSPRGDMPIAATEYSAATVVRRSLC